MSGPKSNTFAVARHWGKYLLFFAVLESALLCFAAFATRFNGNAWTDWCIIIVPLFAAPTVAAIMVSPGSRFRHWVAAFGLLIHSVIMLSTALGEERAEVFIAMGLFIFSVALIQAGWIRWTGRPGWIVRPSTKRSRMGVSLKWLISATGLVAVGFGSLRFLEQPKETAEFFAFFSPSLVATLYANVASTISRKRFRRVLVFGPVVVLSIVYGLVNAGWLPSPASGLPGIRSEFSAKTWFLAPAAAIGVVAMVHRSFVAVGSYAMFRSRIKPMITTTSAEPKIDG